jgi:hypothetical protein
MNIDSATAAELALISCSDSSSASGEAPSHAAKISKRRSTRLSKGNARSRQRKIERAVFSYIRAVRTLGRTKTNTAEVADALSLPVREVNLAIKALKTKGVKEL